MPEEGLVDILWEGGSVCISRGVGSIPRSNDGMGESSGNDCGVGGEMLGVGDGCGVDGEGSRVGITRGVATGGREPCLARVVLMLGLSVVLGLSVAVALRVAASLFGASGI